MRILKNKMFILLSFIILFSGCIYFTSKDYIETNKIEDVYPYADKDTLFIFDIDSTLLHFYMPGKDGSEKDFEFDPAIKYTVENLFKENKENLLKLIYSKGANPDNEQIILKHFDKFLKTKVETYMFDPKKTFYKTAKAKAIDPKTVKFIKQLQDSGTHVIAFTARSWNAREETEEQLLSVGINFNKNLIYDKELVDNTSEPKKQFGYKNGIIFIYKYVGTGENATKGPALVNFLNKINYIPKKVVFVDDSLVYVKSVESCLKEANIPVVAFWYQPWKKDVAIHPETIQFFEKNIGPDWNKVDINLNEATDYILEKLKAKENKEILPVTQEKTIPATI